MTRGKKEWVVLMVILAGLALVNYSYYYVYGLGRSSVPSCEYQRMYNSGELNWMKENRNGMDAWR
jgi:predicted negative regulator of RcsB-dependent stress response